MKYKCDVCNVYEYDSDKGDIELGIKAGVVPADFDNEWKCPICSADKTHIVANGDNIDSGEKKDNKEYLSEWKRASDGHESLMSLVHQMAVSGKSVIEPMSTKKKIISWDNILIKGAQLSKIPLNKEENVNTKTVIGPRAKYPLIIDTPMFITHMSFGALSKEAKIALAKGSSRVKTAMCSGEGGILEESFQSSYKYIFEYVPNEYSVNPDNLKKVDAIEIKFGQSVKPGMGGHLPGAKVTREIARVRGKEEGIDIVSPASFNDIQTSSDLKKKVDWLREKSEGKPIGIKIAAGHIEDDLEVAVSARPDFITIDGRGGSTGAAQKVIKDSTSMPTIFALYRAQKYFEKNKVRDISLIITGGFRISSDVSKAIAMGADAVAIGTAALLAIGCQQYRICNSGNCPVGITTQDKNLRKRFNVEKSAKRLENYLKASTEELKDFARLTGNRKIHDLKVGDLLTDNFEISNFTDIEHV